MDFKRMMMMMISQIYIMSVYVYSYTCVTYCASVIRSHTPHTYAYTCTVHIHIRTPTHAMELNQLELYELTLRFYSGLNKWTKWRDAYASSPLVVILRLCLCIILHRSATSRFILGRCMFVIICEIIAKSVRRELVFNSAAIAAVSFCFSCSGAVVATRRC